MDKYRSEAHQANYETALGLYKAGVIDAAEMREFEQACLVQGPSQRVQAGLAKPVAPAYAASAAAAQ